MNRVGLLHDARFAWRSLARNAGVTAVAVLVLALGIGASTAVFSVFNSILLKPVPFDEPDRLVMLMLTANGQPFFPGSSPAQFVYFQSTANTLEDMAAFTATSFNYTGGDMSARVAGAALLVRTSVALSRVDAGFGAEGLITMQTSLTGARFASTAIRTQGDGAASSRAISEELRAATGVPVTNVRTMDDVLLRSVSRQRLHTTLLGVFGGAAVLLAAIGIYAVIAYVVESRNREIGIRVALGATPARIRRLVVSDGLRWVGLGLAIGLLGAYYLASMLSAVLFGVPPHDLFVFVGVPVTLFAICLLAVVAPVMRASRIAGVVSST